MFITHFTLYKFTTISLWLSILNAFLAILKAQIFKNVSLDPLEISHLWGTWESTAPVYFAVPVLAVYKIMASRSEQGIRASVDFIVKRSLRADYYEE